MAGSKSTLTAARLRELLHYDPETGVFTWNVGRRGKAKAGSPAGSVDKNGYRLIGVDGCPYGAHRLAVIYMTGAQPVGEVDHKNGQKDDNKYLNLRDCIRQTNVENIRYARVDNKSSGVLGVSFYKKTGKWAAQIQAFGKKRFLGYHETVEQAHAAYLSAKRQLHSGCTI